ncbi:MAG: HesA/MoeB/ThiF family protein [Formosimonas sp.]
MNDNQLLRYARHIQLPEIDLHGQQAWLDAHALIIGAGGLGSAAAMYLAASGVGRISLVDDDVVELSNLQRQIIHTTPHLGQSKVNSARAMLHALNPEVQVLTHAQRADAPLLRELAPAADVVLDCSDNFTTRHAVNQACVAAGKPLVSGAAIRFDGQISVFDPRHADAPCYACLFAPQHGVPNEPCASLGVFAPLVGIIGAMQAAEALKVVAHVGEPLTARLLMLDARSMTWRTLNFERNPNCSICG